MNRVPVPSLRCPGHPASRWGSMVLLALALGVGVARADEYVDVNQLHRQGKLTEALAKADQYLTGKPRDPQMRFLRAVVLADSGKNSEATVGLQKLIEDYPELPEPYNNLAVIYASEGQYEKARAALEMAIRLHPGYAAAHENLGDVYARLADQAYSKSLQLEPANTASALKLKLLREFYNARPSGRPSVAPLMPKTPNRTTGGVNPGSTPAPSR